MATTFYNSSGVIAVGNEFVGLVDTTNVSINPAREDGNLSTVVSRLNVNLSTVATEATLSALNTKVTTTANGIRVDGSAVTQPISGPVNVRDGSGNSISSTAGSLNVNITGGSTVGEQHVVDSAGDTYTAGVDQGVIPTARVVSTAPSLTAGQFSALNVSLAGRLVVDGSGVTQPISAASLPLPTGAATEATLSTLATEATLSGIASDVNNLTFAASRLVVDGSQVTQPVSGTITANQGGTWNINNISGTISLPTGAAAEATLSAVNTKLPTSLGQKTMAGSLAVVLASDQSTLNVSLSGTSAVNVSQWGGSATTLGQKLMASSVPVTLASDQSALAVSQSGTWNINNISGTISLPTGAATAANQTTGNSSLSSIDTKTPALGQATMANSSPVVIASNQSAVPISGTVTANAGTGNFTVVQSTASNLNATVTGTVTATQSTGTNLHTVVDSGTVTANIGTTNGLALDATLTNGTQQAKLVDAAGTNLASVSAAGALKVDGSAVTQPISAASLPLPAGAATEATLSTLNGKVPSQGQATMAASLPVVIASDQSTLNVSLTGTANSNISQWGGVATSLGQKLMASSVPVTLASDQSALAVSQSGTWNINNISGTVSLPTGAATSALQTTGNSSLSSIDTKTPALGQATMAASTPVTIASDQTALLVSQSGIWSIRAQDGSGNALTSTAGALDVNITGGNITVGINGDQADLDSGGGTDDHEVFAIGLPAPGGHVVGGTSANPLRVDPTGTTTQPISAASLPLPTGAATEATLSNVETDTTAIASSVSSIDSKTPALVSGRIPVDGSGVTQPVSGTITANAGTGTFTVGQATASNLNATVVQSTASNLNATVVQSTASNLNATVVQSTGTNLHTVVDSGTITANIGTTGGLALESSVTGLSLTQGTTTAGERGILQFGAVSSAAPSYAAGEVYPLSLTTSGLLRVDPSGAVQPVSQSGTWNINNISGTISLPTGAAAEATLSAVNTKLPTSLGQKTMAGSLAVVLASDQSSIPVTLSGTLASNISQWGGVATSLGQKLMASSVPVTLASDQSALAVTGSGNFTVVQATGTNLHTVVDSGTITANIGTAGSLALDTSVNRLNVSQSTALGTNTGPMMQGSVTTNSPSYISGNINPLSLTTAGALRVDATATTQPVSVSFADTTAIDGFARLRVAGSTVIFESQFEYDLRPLHWSTLVATGGTVTHVTNESLAQLAVTTSNASRAVLQTKRYHRYIPGKSHLVVMSAVIGTGQTDTVKRWGYYDDQNGIFFQQSGSTFSVVRRTYTSGTAVDNSVSQASFNIDPLNGTGPSGITLDLTRANIFWLDLQWLGAGRVRMGVQVDGRFITCHEFRNANSLTTVYMSTANLPVRYEIVNVNAVSGAASLKAICCSVMDESETGTLLETYAASSSTSGISVGNGVTNSVMSLRLKSTFGSKTNRATIAPIKADVLVEGANCFYRLVLNPTFGTTQVYTSAGTNSAAEYSNTSSTITGGDIIDSGYLVSGNGTSAQILRGRIEDALTLNNDINSSRDVLAVVITAYAGAVTVRPAMSWHELK